MNELKDKLNQFIKQSKLKSNKKILQDEQKKQDELMIFDIPLKNNSFNDPEYINKLNILIKKLIG
ncbi:hypothetical protein [Candidatus Phytoplasma sacchari]|uniref:Uncharacterized protein n=1 Tax=Candidatus Phytoplasma sacchari TaxID=2609813 RepID=A0ABY7M3C6_9MOLU|nr:hypothetical protein O7R10_00100 [Candidatus Phytoplasma sacchari]